MLECRNMPPSSSRPPVDLILHAAAEALHSLTLAAVKDNNPDDAAKFAACRHGLTRAIRPEALAEEWDDDGPIAQIGEWLASASTGDAEQTRRRRGQYSIAADRVIETAVARRLADTACALTITGDSEDAAQAAALWRAAGALTGMSSNNVEDSLRLSLNAVIAENRRLLTSAAASESSAAAPDALLKTLRQALGAATHADIVAHARAVKAQADRAGVYRDERHAAWAQLDLLRDRLGGATPKDAISNAKALREQVAILVAEQAAITKALGAQEGSDLPAQARLIKARAVENEGMLSARAKWQAERDAIAKALGVQPNTNLAVIADDARRERDAAIEAREAMQVKLYEADAWPMRRRRRRGGCGRRS
jgi:hypothetical protein